MHELKALGVRVCCDPGRESACGVSDPTRSWSPRILGHARDPSPQPALGLLPSWVGDPLPLVTPSASSVLGQPHRSEGRAVQPRPPFSAPHSGSQRALVPTQPHVVMGKEWRPPCWDAAVEGPGTWEGRGGHHKHLQQFSLMVVTCIPLTAPVGQICPIVPVLRALLGVPISRGPSSQGVSRGSLWTQMGPSEHQGGRTSPPL